ncbi:MAG TPA: glycine zipper 2TM domain-containing protein [Alphaproteobacteria bacterium]|nr:glycine zipper 2TM domain-containing protein [Alphaproteobacteria bacterium]
MNTKDIALITLGAIVLVLVTAGASAYVLTQPKDEPAKAEKITWSGERAQPRAQPQQVAANCDDDNIVGKVVGGVGGGLLGSQVGKGGGKTAATIGGSVGGTLLGEEFIPARNVTCR